MSFKTLEAARFRMGSTLFGQPPEGVRTEFNALNSNIGPSASNVQVPAKPRCTDLLLETGPIYMVKLLVLMQDNVAQWSLGTQSMALMQLLYERGFISKNMGRFDMRMRA